MPCHAIANPPAPPPTSEGSGEAWVSRALGPALARVANHTNKSLEPFPTNGWKRKEKKLFTGEGGEQGWLPLTHCSFASVCQAPHLPRISTARQPGRPEHRGDANPVCAPSASGGNTGPLDLSIHCHCACERAGYEHGTCSLLHMGRTRQTDRTGRIDSNCRARGRAGSAARACVTRRPSRRQLRGHRHPRTRRAPYIRVSKIKKEYEAPCSCCGCVEARWRWRCWCWRGCRCRLHWALQRTGTQRPVPLGAGRPDARRRGWQAGGRGRRARTIRPSHPSIHPSVAVHHRVLAAAANRSSCMARGIACNCICICRRHDGQNYGASEHRAGTTHHEPTTTATTMHASTMLVRQSFGQRRPSS